ncbi:MAG: hypothetical protein JNL69_06685 [Bacteroidia bacterium]|nr:hypothetical protein [Bacteroidia bacterium]
MIKRLLVICFIFFTIIHLNAQSFGNEWIDYSQKYYKIKIAQNGIYRIDSTALANAGIDLSTIDPRNFQLFNNGQEHHIFVQGENDGIFNSSDFIEFYAKKNDGTLDSALYFNSAFIPNPYYSLINDTAVYYLTWNSLTTNKRLQLETDTTFSAYTPSAYFYKEEIKDFHNGYYAGETDVVGGTDARYTKSEGWFDADVITLGSNKSYNSLINTSNAYTTAGDALFKSVVIGASKAANLIAQGLNDHHLQIEYRGSSGTYTLLKDTLFKGYEANRFVSTIPVNNLGNTFTDFRYSSVADAGFVSNRTVVSYIYLKYPHTFDLEGKSTFDVLLPDDTQAKSFLNISNFNATGGAVLYDITNHKRVELVSSGLNFNALVPNSGGEKYCYLTSISSIVFVSSITPVSATATFTDYSLQATDSAYVIISHTALMNEANLYKQYRSLNMYGGNHNVVLADINELYDQFAFGIVKSPFSIRNFSNYLLNTYPTKPQNLFLIGKSIHVSDCRQNTNNYTNCLVPSMGNPSSDILLTSNLNGSGLAPAIAIGRLAAKTPLAVNIYLNKVVDYENRLTNPPAEWMKHALHFGGGGSAAEQAQLRNYLNTYKSIFQDTLYGGTVIKEFWKTSTDPIQSNIADTLEDLIDNGVSMMTFFGHATANSFDQSIDQILTFNPIAGHYPFMISNACYSGDLHSAAASSSEDYVIAQNKGLIGFLGAIKLGVPYALHVFSQEFYSQMAKKNYLNGIGSSIKKTIESIEPLANMDPLVMTTCYEMALHGDPAVNINAHKKPDYKITNADVSFDLISQPTKFKVFASITNLGKTVGDSIFTELYRMFPNGDTVRYNRRHTVTKFKDTVVFEIPFDFSRDAGINKFKVTVDAFNTVDELNEFNNTTNPLIDIVINGGDIIPVYPYEFAIVPTDTITLKASTANVFALSRNYVFQIDTTDAFNSPFLKDTIISSIGGVVKWKPAITLVDSTVYYWRVSPDSTSPTSSFVWRESSFQYIFGKRGWEQAHFFQFKSNQYQYVKYVRPQRKFEFVNDVKVLNCKNGIYPHIYPLDISYGINGSLLHYWSCAPFTGVSFAVFDQFSTNPWYSVLQNSSPPGAPQVDGMYGQYGDRHCVTRDLPSFDFYTHHVDPAYPAYYRPAIKNFIDSIPNGAYILAYSQGDHGMHYDTTLYMSFESFGSSQVRTLVPNRPFIMYGRKGQPIGSAREIVGDSVNSIINFDTTLVSNWNEGFIASPVIGPASSWGSLHWRQHHIDGASSADSIVVRMIGIRANGTEQTLANFTKDSVDILNLSSYIDVTQFPKMRMIAFMKDDSMHTPPQMERWQVIYAPVPEAAVNPVAGYTVTTSTLQEGDNLNVCLPIQNIGDVPFNDSLLVTYWIEDLNGINHPLPDKIKKNIFLPGEIIMDTIVINTAGYRGDNALWVEVNPINKPKSQLEQYHFNNIIRIPFYTSIDRINPLLDVTFDGIHILNNDIVSAKPSILIKLKDENQFLALNDTSDFKLFVRTPTSSIPQRIWFSEGLMFTEAILPNNSCKIHYNPIFIQDGTYQLIVQAKDKSDNLSGAIDYKINFEIINRSTITEIMNYPNPFSTSTRFVFTLTGDEIPTTFKIQIMTITGKVVREIFQDEIGPIRIGRNITEFAWDGKDEFGDQLANGVYMYRVITKINGQDIEKRETQADQYFKKGWGKMYLMR